MLSVILKLNLKKKHITEALVYLLQNIALQQVAVCYTGIL